MKIRSHLILVCLSALSACVSITPENKQPLAGTALIDRVFLAQQHVLEPTSPYFKLVGNLETLLKVQVYADKPVPAPYVYAILELNDKSRELALRGPAILPIKPDADPVLFEHTYDDSFTASIPKEWIKSGLRISVELRDYDYNAVHDDDKDHGEQTAKKYITVLDKKDLGMLNIGAPTHLVMQFFDIHYFGKGKGADYPEGWERELAAKLPVSEMTVHRVKNIMFNEIVMPPQGDRPSTLYTSEEDYLKKTGQPFDGEQGIALRWCAALKAAGGSYGLWRPYNVNIAGVYSGGQAGGYRSCANLHRHGVLIHELGHTFGLPHWNNSKVYPYKRTMYGLDQGEPDSANAGPTWAFDVGTREFLSPRETLPDGTMRWTRDPMQGGGRSNLKNYLYKHFSDFSVHRMQFRLENQAVYWNEVSGQYAQWNQETADYDKIVENDGVKLPIERDVEVISILATANAAVPEANIIYPPIGPYTAGLIRRFDADSEKDRQEAAQLGYSAARCNVALRVTQGETTKTYLMPAKVSPDDNPMRAFTASAINLPARDGQVTKAELLYCPDLIEKGVTPGHKVLYTWPRK